MLVPNTAASRPSFTALLWGCSMVLWPQILKHVSSRVDGELSSYVLNIHGETGRFVRAVYAQDGNVQANTNCGGSMSCHKLLEEKATALEHCPMEVLVVDFTPCDTAWRAQRSSTPPTCLLTGQRPWQRRAGGAAGGVCT